MEVRKSVVHMLAMVLVVVWATGLFLVDRSLRAISTGLDDVDAKLSEMVTEGAYDGDE